MQYRKLGKTNFKVSEVSLGAWQIGGSWGDVSDKDAERVVHAAIESGINFIDTADVYGDGRSERFIAKVLSETKEQVFVATKAGRRLQPHTVDGYNRANLTAFVDRSLKNLRREVLDLVQLHCPPTGVYYEPEVFAALDELKQAGKILYYGVSVEKVEEALKAIEYPGLATVQIIFNIFRQRPKDLFFPLAQQRDVGILPKYNAVIFDEEADGIAAGVDAYVDVAARLRVLNPVGQEVGNEALHLDLVGIDIAAPARQLPLAWPGQGSRPRCRCADRSRGPAACAYPPASAAARHRIHRAGPDG